MSHMYTMYTMKRVTSTRDYEIALDTWKCSNHFLFPFSIDFFLAMFNFPFANGKHRGV